MPRTLKREPKVPFRPGPPSKMWGHGCSGTPTRVGAAVVRSVVSQNPNVSPSPFVGRGDELDLLRLVFNRVGGGSPHLVTVTGEAGVGKGRLVAEFVTALEADGIDAAVLRGRCTRSGLGVSFRALRQMVRTHIGIAPGDAPGEVHRKIVASVEDAVPEEAERDWVIARLAPLIGVSAELPRLLQGVDQSEWFAAWQTFLVGTARANGSLILVFRDLQWAEPALLGFIRFLVDASAGANLMVICLARPDLYDRSPDWGGGKRLSMALSLSPLNESETAELLDGLIESGDCPGSLDPITKRDLIERSGGIPLFAEQFMRLVAGRTSPVDHIDRPGSADGAGRAAEGRTDAALEADGAIPVPRSLRSLIESRLADLPPDRRHIVMDAAVVGRQFWVGAVAAVAGRDEEDVRDGLQELARGGLIRPVQQGRVDALRPAGDQEFVFTNGLIRDVAYGSIPPDELASEHSAAAEWIEQAGARIGEQTDMLAHHFERAADLAATLPADERGDLDARRLAERAVEHLEVAGDRALGFDVVRARQSYERALELCPPDHPLRRSVLGRVARAVSLMGDFEEAARRYDDVIAASVSAGDTAAAGEAMLDLSYALWNQGITGRAREVLAEGIAVLEREERGEVLALGYAMVAADRFLAGRSEEALRWCEKVLAIADELDLPERRERALEVRGMARCDLGDQGGLEDLRAALAMALDLGLGQEVVRAYINLGTFVLPVEGPAAALELYRSAQALAERRGLTGMSMWARGWAVGPLFELGRWDELLEEAAAAVEWERAHGGLTQFGLAARLTEAEVHVLRGDVDRAASLVGEFLPQAREIDDPQALIPALAVAGLVAQAQRDPALAAELIEELITRRTGGRWASELFLALSVRILLWAGRQDAAVRLLDDADQATPRGRYSAESARAALVEGDGGHEEAAGLYGAAAAGWEDFGFVLERALALEGAARCLAAIGRTAEAEDGFATAQRLMAGLGMPSASGGDGSIEATNEPAPAGDATG